MRLAVGLRSRGVSVRVLTFYSGGSLAADLVTAGVPVLDLGKRSRWDLIGFTRRLIAALRLGRPRWIIAYMTGPNLAASCAAWFVPGTAVVWNVVGSQRDRHLMNRVERAASSVLRFLADGAEAVVVNSDAGRSHLLATGFPPDRTFVVRNGVDAEAFRPRPDLRDEGRRLLGVDADAVVFGVVGRLHPVKGQAWAIRALAQVLPQIPTAVLACVGRGTEEQRTALEVEADQLGVSHHVRWIGEQNDVVPIYEAIDVIVSPSESEGLSNVLLEAMTCGVVPVATDVGDSAVVVSSFGYVVPPRDPDALAAAMVAGAQDARDPDVVWAIRSGVVARFGEGRMIDETIEIIRTHRRDECRRWASPTE